MAHRLSRSARGLLAVGAIGLGGYWYDRQVQASSLTRTLRTLYANVMIIVDYKWNFQPGKADRINDLHSRVARRVLDVCEKNGGLYIKFGQAVALYSTILPPQYNQIFKTMYDEAPSIPYAEVVRIFECEFGRRPEDLFAEFEAEPVASASIAQVHRARLRCADGYGAWVAVKVQKPAIATQMDWDLATIRWVVKGLEWAFDLPLTWSLEYTCDHIRQEIDFINEGRNAERARSNVNQDAKLARHLYIPRVYWEYTRRRIMTAEWIEGTRLSQLKGGQAGTDFYRPAEVMNTLVSAFASQIFVHGFVHADPHPGNIILRRHPSDPRTYQAVLIDHGLYLREDERFRNEYCRLWTSLLLMDMRTVRGLCARWGVGDPDMLASFTLLRPFRSQGSPAHLQAAVSREELYQMQLNMKQNIHHFLTDTERFPKDLIFIGRNMNMVRGLNKMLGSPVNRIGIMADYAARGLGAHWQAWTDSERSLGDGRRRLPAAWGSEGLLHAPGRYLGALGRYLATYVMARLGYYTFRFNLALVSLTFSAYGLWSAAMERLTGREARNIEQVMDDSIINAVEQQLGYKIDTSIFEA